MIEEPDQIVFIVDDDASVRDALVSLLASVGQKALAFATPEAFLASGCPDGPSCVVLDVRLPDRSGLDVQRDLVAAGVFAPVIFISGHADVPMSVAGMKAGAIEFLTKPFRDQDLLDAIQRGIRIDRARQERAAELEGWRRMEAALTPREREVMSLVAQGHANKEIARSLAISEITVKVHRAQVMRKMAARSLPELVRIFDRLQAG
ncbi:MAG: response regulator [Paracoccaceae bacterium]